MSIVRCLAVDSTCWPTGAARLGPLDDTRLQQGLQARAADKGKGLRTGLAAGSVYWRLIGAGA
jgi:hypothetical protein